MNSQECTFGYLTQELSPAVPDEIIVFPPGIVRTTKYAPLTVNAAAGAKCIAAYKRLGRDLVIDYEHGGLDNAKFIGEAPAAGWIRSLSWDERRGLVARVSWTSKARAMIQDREYRYLSPVYTSDGGELQELLAASLTNDPAMIDPVALAASRAANVAAAAATSRSDIERRLGALERRQLARGQTSMTNDQILSEIRSMQARLDELAAQVEGNAGGDGDGAAGGKSPVPGNAASRGTEAAAGRRYFPNLDTIRSRRQ